MPGSAENHNETFVVCDKAEHETWNKEMYTGFYSFFRFTDEFMGNVNKTSSKPRSQISLNLDNFNRHCEEFAGAQKSRYKPNNSWKLQIKYSLLSNPLGIIRFGL